MRKAGKSRATVWSVLIYERFKGTFMARLSKQSQTMMEELQLTYLQFQNYRLMFTDNRCVRPYYELRIGRNTNRLRWACLDYHWSPKMLLQHLKGERVLALKPKPFLRYLMIDIDNHGRASVSVEERARMVLASFDGSPLIYTSSVSGGLRVVYFLDKAYHVSQIEAFARAALTSNGVTITPGSVELCVDVESDRLPFGNGSYVVDPCTLDPIYDLSKGGQIDFAYSVYQKDNLVLPTEYCDYRVENKSTREFFTNTERLIREGLCLEVSTNEALWRIIDYLYRKFDIDRAKIEEFVLCWLHECHNGCSDSINMGDFAKNERRISEMLKRFDSNRIRSYGGYFTKSAETLSLKDIAAIVELSSDYKTQLRLYGLFGFAKANGIRVPSIECAQSLLDGSPATLLVSSTDNDRPTEIWICTIPSYVWKDRLGFAASAYSAQRKALEDLNVVALVYEGSHERKRCACYAIKFHFDDSEPLVSCLDDGLVQLFSRTELKQRYGAYRARKLVGHSKRNLGQRASVVTAIPKTRVCPPPHVA